MPRKRNPQPVYSYHISGQARVWLDGKTYYLGPHGSKESWAKYYALLAEYSANGQRMPEKTPTRQIDAVITVRCVTGEFRHAIATKYANNPGRTAHFSYLCTMLEDEYGDVPAAEFGPRRLAELREIFVEAGNVRRYVNTQTRSVIAIFRHAVSRELIAAETLVALQALDPLRAGQTTAKESTRREPVDIEHVRKTAEHLSPPLRAMVQIAIGTGMRPSEIFNLRPQDIDRSGLEWVYRPASHKTAHRGKGKAVPIVDDAREALTPFLLRAADAYCFSPKESKAWYTAQRASRRVTPRNCGNNLGTNRKKDPKRQPGDKFTKDGFAQAIQRAALKAKVPHWTPYQCRHLTATAVRNALGIEAAQALLGHSRADMTEHYARLSLERATAAAKAAPTLQPQKAQQHP